MLQNLRSSIQGTAAKVVIALIAVPFVLTGAETLLSTGGSQKVAKVNGEEITLQQLEEELFLLKRRMLAQLGDQLDPSMLDDNRLRAPALESLVNRTVLEQAAADNGFIVAESDVNRMIIQTPEFQEDGRFSKERYAAVLSAAGFTPALYKRLYRSDVLRNQFVSGYAQTEFFTDKELANQAQFLYQTRDVRYLVLDVEKELAKVTVSDAEVEQFYNENPAQFTSVEQVIVDYIELKQADFAVEVSEDEIRAAYDNEISNAGGEEQRQVSHILLMASSADERKKATAQLQEAKARLAKGETFAQLAKELSDDTGSKDQGGFLGTLQVEAFPEAFVAAANQLAEGEVSDIVETEAGLHLIRVDQLLKNTPATFAERREALATELKQAKASPLFWAAVEQLKDLSFNAQDLQQPAAALNVKVQQSPAFSRQGGAGLFANAGVYQTAFSDNVLKNGYNSDVIEIAGDHVVVLRLNEHRPAALLPFNEVKAIASSQVKQQKAIAALEQKAEQLQQELVQGNDIEQLAKKHQLEWQVLLATGRNVAGSAAEIVAYAFDLPAVNADQRAIDKLTLRNGNVSVLVVENVKAGDIANLKAAELAGLRQYITQSVGGDVFQLQQAQLEQQASIKRY